MRRYIALISMLLVAYMAPAQKNTVIEFSSENLPAELLEYANGGTSDKDKQKENRKTVDAFSSSYNTMAEAMQKRVANLYTYAVKVKMKGNPELMDFTRVLTAYAATDNLEGWVAAVETYRKKNSKAKYVTDFVAWSELLLTDRVLYRSATSEWGFDNQTPFRLGVEDGSIKAWFDRPAELHYASTKDWNTLHGTTGVFDYKEGMWNGRGGRLDWARTGLGAEACYADLNTYRAEVKFPKFTADSVQFTNTHYFPDSVATSATLSSRTSYPMWITAAASS